MAKRFNSLGKFGLIAGLAAAALCGTESSARANEVAQAGNFGAGIVLGYPAAGLTFNYFLENDRSLQINPVLAFGDNHSGFGARVDYLFHMDPLASGSAADLIWYVGPGLNAYIWSHDDGNRRFKASDRSARDGFYLGVEVPIGLAVQFQKAPVDIFVEAVPWASVITSHGVGIAVDIGADIGARYYF